MPVSKYQEGLPRYWNCESKRRKVSAKMEIDGSQFVIKVGSQVKLQASLDSNKREQEVGAVRNQMIEEGKLSQEGDFYICREDVVFKDASRAATFVNGNGINGNDFWTDAGGKTLKEWKATVNTQARTVTQTPTSAPVSPPTVPVPPAVQSAGKPQPRTIPKLHDKLLRMHGPGCQGCGRTFENDTRFLEIDHNTPKACGGTDDVGNRVLLCGPCNRIKGAERTIAGLRKENLAQGYPALAGKELYYFD